MATRIQDLPAASQITSSDFFVIQQGGEAKKLSGAEMTQYIAGHGCINSITLNDDYTLTFTMTDGEEITVGSIRGQNGEDGFSPSVTLTEGENGVNLTITDRLGPHTTFIANGEDGFSPSVTLTPTAGGTNLTIVDATGPHTAFIANGEGSGDMLSDVYDPQGEVAAVGIPAYVEAHGTQNAVRYDEDQGLTTAQKAQARENINAAAPDGYYGNSGGTMQYATNFVGQLTPQNASNVVFRPTASNFSGSGWSADSISGNTATIEKIKGKTIVFNQLVKNGNFDNNANWASESGVTFNASNNTALIVSDIANNGIYQNIADIKLNHKYIITIKLKASSQARLKLGMSHGGFYSPVFDVGTTVISKSFLLTVSSLNASNAFYILPQTTDVTFTVYSVNMFDITQMYGQGREPQTVEEFKAQFPLDYYAYNPGELVSFNGTGLKTTGFNQLYPNGHINVLAGLTYKIEGTYTSLKDSAGNDVTVTDNEFTPIADDTYTMVGGSCVHLKWSGVRDGETEPHWDSELSLPIATYFADGMKSAENAYDELTKDRAIKRIGVVDLGNADWRKDPSTATENFCFYTDSAFTSMMKKPNSNADIANIRCKLYTTSAVIYSADYSAVNKQMWLKSNGQFFIRDSAYSTPEEFKTAMSGVYLYYELAEPVETPISPELNLTYRCDDFGTEMLLPQNDDEPVTAPLDMDVVYGLDYEANIRNMPANYANNNFVNALAAGLKNAGINMAASNDFGAWLVSIAYGGLPFTTSAPTAANTDGGLKVAYLDTEPATKYDGWLYLIKE